ncbi:unnamed protein product [Linum trigynum]|uniref:Uncharacterized protein n=1 Tax=Linum trigynum TaxID=586398 RepID=A0AAV2CUU1_9ROSI
MAEEAIVELVPETLETPHPSAASPTDSPTAVVSDPSLLRNASFSKLNARAPQFVPSKQPPPPASMSPPLPSRLAVMPPPPGAAMIHMYSTVPTAAYGWSGFTLPRLDSQSSVGCSRDSGPES